MTSVLSNKIASVKDLVFLSAVPDVPTHIPLSTNAEIYRVESGRVSLQIRAAESNMFVYVLHVNRSELKWNGQLGGWNLEITP